MEIGIGESQPKLTVEEGHSQLFMLDYCDSGLQNITFSHCIFENLIVDLDVIEKLPRFFKCHFGEIEGIVSLGDHSVILIECTVDSLQPVAITTKDYLKQELDQPLKVMQTVIKKVFFQKGSGRQLSALHRGLDAHSKRYVDPIVEIMCAEE